MCLLRIGKFLCRDKKIFLYMKCNTNSEVSYQIYLYHSLWTYLLQKKNTETFIAFYGVDIIRFWYDLRNETPKNKYGIRYNCLFFLQFLTWFDSSVQLRRWISCGKTNKFCSIFHKSEKSQFSCLIRHFWVDSRNITRVKCINGDLPPQTPARPIVELLF